MEKPHDPRVGGLHGPGGMVLDDTIEMSACPECGKPARYRQWEACEGDSLDTYYRVNCRHGSYFEGDESDEP